MRATLTDDAISDEDKKGLIEKWYVCLNAKGKQKKALQASKCQASSSNELGCKDTCLLAGLFPHGAKEIILEQGKEWVEAELKPKLEELCKEIDKELQVARIMLDLKNNWKLDVLADQTMLGFKNNGDQQ